MCSQNYIVDFALVRPALRNRALAINQGKKVGRFILYNPLKPCCTAMLMEEREYKEKVKTDDDEKKVEREFKDEFGNKVKEKHEVKLD